MGVHDVHRSRLLETDIPARLVRLSVERVALAGRPRARDHALGITWLLDGLEVTLVGAVANVLGKPELAVPAEGRSL